MASDEILHPVPSPVSRAIVAVCEKCGKKLSGGDGDDNPARQLQKSLKEDFKSLFGKGVIRPVVSSCMDVCPKDQVTIGVFAVDEPNQPQRFFTVEQRDFDKVSKSLVKLLCK